ncbi:hypothetical protein PR202_gb01935 [Eleusine coracana subsp. coracana]|uniref:Disease resistance N-terminal domain-containing protein n=1 Tax=Eleusine coracana subsp. coracana TaxID=191504 RepID=A0AAV5DY01_ELECO|nr:hypothetical protein PR202_gb01935 [Eleusine coracana subsp. coracana]
MELIVSAVAGDLVNRFISFMVNRYRSKENLSEKIEKLQELLLRVHMIVEEADARYITNSRMLLQLKKFVEVMYQGYHVLDTIKYKTLCRATTENEVLAFGSTNPEEHPQLASISNDLAVALSGSLITANVYADILRRNQNARFWLSILKKYRNVVENNFSVFGEHPKNLMDKDHPIDITRFASSLSSLSFATLRLIPPHIEVNDDSKRKLPKVMFGDMIAGTTVLPKEDFELVAWESRIPPYKRFVNLATYCDDHNSSQDRTESPSNKRQRFIHE